MDVARSAALDAAWDVILNVAWDAILEAFETTKIELQNSAVFLVERMIAAVNEVGYESSSSKGQTDGS